MRHFARLLFTACSLLATPICRATELAGDNDPAPLVVAANGKTAASIVVAANAGKWERRAADDLALFVERMCGAKLPIVDTDDGIAKAKAGSAPTLVVGQVALAWEPSLNAALRKAAKPNPVLQSDSLVARRTGSRVYLAGNSDKAHYFALVELLNRWGCRWFLPTDFGEYVPDEKRLLIGKLDYAYGSPFEVRKYWISWNGDGTGAEEFRARNFMNDVSVPNGHILGKYTKDLVPKGKSVFNVPITADSTADHVAKQVAPIYAEGKHVQLGIEDGIYESDDPLDQELNKLQWDKYFLKPSTTDAFMVFYNKVAERLMKQYPQSNAKIGFLAYANLTIPPVRDITAAKPLVAYLAPIDIDPIHGMDDPKSPPKHELKEMLYRWAKLMQGRVVIYDYDQGMLVWRDIPAPSMQMFRQDVKHFQKAGILGVDTESRNAIATVFTNLYFRGQLLWNPDADVDQLQREFCAKFYGVAAKPMESYWGRIINAWNDSIVTEHEYFVAPAIYTPELLAALKVDLVAAEKLSQPLTTKRSLSRNEKLVVERMQFTRLGFDLLEAYMTMVRAAATDADYATAVKAGQRGLEIREQLTAMNGTFTTYKRMPENGAAWWPGDVQYHAKLQSLTDGTKGKLLAKLPLEWAFRRDPKDVGVKEKYFVGPIDLTYWNGLTNRGSIASRQQNPGHWEMVRTDLYLQAQGVIEPDFQSYTGHGWYRTEFDLNAADAAGSPHLMFPGIFNECWLYVNGQEVAARKQNPVWWYNNYEFSWDVDLTGKLKSGKNEIAIRFHNPHHFGGMFRRPFVYSPSK